MHPVQQIGKPGVSAQVAKTGILSQTDHACGTALERRLSGTYLWTQLSAPSGMSIFNNHIARTKLNYQFSRRLSFRAIIDYNAVLANRSLVSTDPVKRLTGDFLMTYLLNPGTALYLGYTDIYENLRIRGEPAAPFRGGTPSFSTGRQLFVKISYLLRF